MARQCGESYRPDIHGLRAVAVLSVLLFHANLGCPGGFVGVDIFFVISGFLIFSLIRDELNSGTFSLIVFWERRIRRILPALAAMVLAVYVAGWFLFLPEDFAKLGKATMAQATLASNFFFYQQWLGGTGYFAPALDPKPLLHTWSLAVEEQFYLLFPPIIMLAARWPRRPLAETLLIIAIGSFVLSIYGSFHYPAATFYLLPARAWELLLGALLVLMRGSVNTHRWMAEAAGWLGFLLIGVSIFLYDSYTRFPGRAAMPPCLGTALIILSSETKLSRVGQILSWKPVVFIGLISYSLYLWHWPLLVFSKYPANTQNWEIRTLMLAASVVLAALSWKFIELPFRKRRVFPKRSQILWFGGLSSTTLVLAGLAVMQLKGVPWRYSGQALIYDKSRNDFAFRNEVSLDQAVAGQFPKIGPPGINQPINLLIWGDSHAMAVTPVLDELCRKLRWLGIEATHSATAPVLKFQSNEGDALGKSSPAFSQAVVDYIGRNHIQHVVLAANWKYYPPSEEFKSDLLATIRAVLNLNAKVYVLKDVPNQASDVAAKTALAVLHGGDLDEIGVTPAEHCEANCELDQTFVEISKMGAVVLDPAEYFLNSKGLYGVVKNGEVLYWDDNHLTVQGARLLAPLFRPIFENK